MSTVQIDPLTQTSYFLEWKSRVINEIINQ